MSTIKMHVKDLWISFIRPGSGDFSLSPEERKALHHRRVEKVIRFCWALIMIKSFAVVWLVVPGRRVTVLRASMDTV